jgi:hypothetical protein
MGIKGKIMKFKVGDWVMVIQNSAPILYQGYYEIPHRITEISNCIIVDDDTPLGFSECNLKLWQPKVGELCWFWDDNQLLHNGTPHFGRYGVGSYTLSYYDNCEPFFGSIPSFSREIK